MKVLFYFYRVSSNEFKVEGQVVASSGNLELKLALNNKNSFIRIKAVFL